MMAISVVMVVAETAAEATAADAPKVRSKVELVRPKPIPSEPSTNWAIDPASAKKIQFIKLCPKLFLYFLVPELFRLELIQRFQELRTLARCRSCSE